MAKVKKIWDTTIALGASGVAFGKKPIFMISRGCSGGQLLPDAFM